MSDTKPAPTIDVDAIKAELRQEVTAAVRAELAASVKPTALLGKVPTFNVETPGNPETVLAILCAHAEHQGHGPFTGSGNDKLSALCAALDVECQTGNEIRLERTFSACADVLKVKV